MNTRSLSIEIIDPSLADNHIWKKVITSFAVIGQTFEIHCWREETEEINAALQYGRKKQADWEYGTIIEGTIDDRFLNMLHHTQKPVNARVANKMTPFFSIFLENVFSSEHYGTELHILTAPVNDSGFTMLLEQLQEYAIIHEI